MNKKHILLILIFYAFILLSQTSGKIKGYVTDENGDPLPGANVTVTGTMWGAETDASGYYFIIGVRAGTYDLKSEFVGYRSKEAKGIKVKTGLTTSQNFKLSSEEIELEAIGVEVVTEQKVEKDVTTSMRNIDIGNVEKLAITRVDELLKTTAGVKTDSEGELHFRGGRSGEVNYIIDGVAVGDPTGDKTNPVEINFANVESFNIMKGVPDAEYGDALSGTVNIVMKTGDQEKTAGYVKYETDTFFGGSTLDYDRGEFSISGPVPFAINGSRPTYYIGSDLTVQNGYSESYRKKGDENGDYFEFEDRDLTGFGFKMPERRENSFNFIVKGTYDLNPTMKLSASYMKTRTHNYEYDYYYRYTPQTSTESSSDVSILNVNWRHTIDKSSYYELVLSRYNREYESLPGGKTPDEFVLEEAQDMFVADYSDLSANNDVIRNTVRDGGEAEGYIDVNQSGYFDREYYIDNSGSGYYNQYSGDIFYAFDPAFDSNMNGVWDGDRLYDSNGDGLWNYWEKGSAYSGFNGDCLYGEIVEGYTDANMNGVFENNLYSAEDKVPGSDEPYIDGDRYNDTGEPFIDQRKFRNITQGQTEKIIEYPNGLWDKETSISIKIFTLRINESLGFEEIHKDIRDADFNDRLTHQMTSPYYLADTLYFRQATGKTIVLDSITYDLVDQYLRIKYKDEDFANLKSSLGSVTQDVPRVNNIYNGAGDNIFDEFEAYCEFRPYGSDTDESALGWKVNADYYEYVGTYSVFKAPKALYDQLPNVKELTHNEYCTWSNLNPDVNNIFDKPDGAFTPGEVFTDWNNNGNWNANTGFLLPGQYLDGITYSLFDNTVTKLKGNYTNQINKYHMTKAGFEIVFNDLDYYSITNPYQSYDTEQYVVAEGDPYPDRGREKTVYSYKPMEFSGYVQNKMEFEDLVVNAGLRMDMRVLDDKAVDDYNEGYDQGLPGYDDSIDQIKYALSPRLGISHSISESSKLFFSYGHLYQLPQYTLVFDTNTKAVENPLFGNMNLDFEHNIQYELGIVNEFGSYLLDVTGYFKDIYDMINTRTYQSAMLGDAAVFSNSDYGKTRGIELTVDKALSDKYLWSFSYTLSYAYGKSSTQTSNLNEELIVIKESPLDWDERHTINSYFALVYGENETLFGIPYTDDWNLSISTDFGSGKPFTPAPEFYSDDYDPAKIVTNSERLPWTSNTDVKFVKSFQLRNEEKRSYGRLKFEFTIFNLFDKINVKTVYTDTGKWNRRSEAYYFDELYAQERSNLIEIFENPSNIEERRHYRFGINYNW